MTNTEFRLSRGRQILDWRVENREEWEIAAGRIASISRVGGHRPQPTPGPLLRALSNRHSLVATLRLLCLCPSPRHSELLVRHSPAPPPLQVGGMLAACAESGTFKLQPLCATVWSLPGDDREADLRQFGLRKTSGPPDAGMTTPGCRPKQMLACRWSPSKVIRLRRYDLRMPAEAAGVKTSEEGFVCPGTPCTGVPIHGGRHVNDRFPKIY